MWTNGNVLRRDSNINVLMVSFPERYDLITEQAGLQTNKFTQAQASADGECMELSKLKSVQSAVLAQAFSVCAGFTSVLYAVTTNDRKVALPSEGLSFQWRVLLAMICRRERQA